MPNLFILPPSTGANPHYNSKRNIMNDTSKPILSGSHIFNLADSFGIVETYKKSLVFSQDYTAGTTNISVPFEQDNYISAESIVTNLICDIPLDPFGNPILTLNPNAAITNNANIFPANAYVNLVRSNKSFITSLPLVHLCKAPGYPLLFNRFETLIVTLEKCTLNISTLAANINKGDEIPFTWSLIRRDDFTELAMQLGWWSKEEIDKVLSLR